jgi:gamma-glutamyltranspeptidase/glutathione hydrolase
MTTTHNPPSTISIALAAAVLFTAVSLSLTAQSAVSGMREPTWAPDGKHLAVVFLDRIYTVLPDGREPRELTRSTGIQREPAWSTDGRRLAFAADSGDGFDLFIISTRGGTPQRITSLPGDERSPSWAPDGRVVFSHRAAGARQWDLYVVDPDASDKRDPVALTQSQDDEMHPRVSPDGTRVAFTSNRDNEDGDFDLWMMRLLDRGAAASVDRASPSTPLRASRGGPATRLTRARGYEAYPAWSPEGDRIAFYAIRDGVGSTWVEDVRTFLDATQPAAPARPVAPAVLVSRHGGSLSWSPDGHTIAIGEIPDADQSYNGNPLRDTTEPPALFELGRAYQLWTVPAPRVVDEGGRALAPSLLTTPASMVQAFDSVWTTMKRLYYQNGESARVWDSLRARFRPAAEQARTPSALEDVVDELIAAEPLVKPAVSSSQAVVVSAHPLASEAGRLVLERGGNIVDAAIAVAFTLGVVEPDASGLGGDGQAVLFLKGMSEPTVIEYKDQTPAAATLDNPHILLNGRLVGDGPAAANIPGLVAGLDYLHSQYGSGRVTWPDLIEPAIRHAENGFTLDSTLPSTIAEGRQVLEKYSAASRLFLSNRQVPKAGDRFVNRDLATTLRTLAREGAESFYRGSIAQRIAADMVANGGLITTDDLAQYRAMERKPVSMRYRDRVLYTGGPPVAAGVSLLEALSVLGNYRAQPHASATADADYWHYQIEAWKARDRITRIADPARWAVEFEPHLASEHAADLFRRISGQAAARYPDDSDEPAMSGERIGSGTTAIVVADSEGNMIAMTNTLSTWGGSFYVSRGLGFLYNNHLRSNRTTAGAYGQLLPLTRSNTANIPMLAFSDDDGRQVPSFAMGAAGNAWIPASTYSIVTALIDGGLSMQRAIEAPRFLVTRDPADAAGTAARIEIEDRFPRAIVTDLMARGHRFHKVGRKGEMRYGYASGALVDMANHRVEGGADPRRSHTAVAVDSVRRLTQ